MKFLEVSELGFRLKCLKIREGFIYFRSSQNWLKGLGCCSSWKRRWMICLENGVGITANNVTK